MKINQKRIQEKSKFASITKKLHDYVYFETLVIVTAYLFIGYMIDPNDICILGGQISYMLILLSIVTLFHGFESGMMTTGILAVAMWYFYPIFQYVDFMVALMMTLIFSEFNYYWNKRIKEAETDSEYRGLKLNELSKAFYTLKISHDQLEKNYVIKPMSLRNSLSIIKESSDNGEDYYDSFLKLLDKAFNVNIATIVSKDAVDKEFNMIAKTVSIHEETNYEDLLIKDVLQRRKPVYISDETNKKSKYIAVVPALKDKEVAGLLLIEKMPFMSFNKENLTSISILFEYFFNEMRKKTTLYAIEGLAVIQDDDFRYEYYRLDEMYALYGVDSISLVFKTDDELLANRLYVTSKKLIRSLDMVACIKHTNFSQIALLFPFADKSSAYGFLHRLLEKLKDVGEDDFEYMTFNLSKKNLFEKYLSADYVQ
ncbi:hypothetical protein KKG72_10195 [bacterium]|nr:hypothetical protein [bacterium]MBU1995213.1 hypothetical protein [bacterium]